MAHSCNPRILSLIFTDALQNDTSSLLTLRSVNRAWFDATGNTPQLWTRLVLNRKSDFTNLEYAQFYLQKSGALPIDVHIALPDDVAEDEIGGVASLLRDHSSRFRSFDLHVRIHDELEVFISSIGEDRPAPLLEQLVLKVRQCTESSNVTEFLSLPTAFTPSPRLAHIELPGWPLPKTFPHLPTVTSLIIDSMPFDSVAVDEIVSYLDSTPSLQYLMFKGQDDFSHNIASELNYPRIVSLPDLLTADVTAPGAGADLLRAINAPELTDVRLDGFRAHHFEGRWEESLTESLTVTVRHLSAHSRNLQCMTLERTEFLSPLEDYELLFSHAGFPKLEELLLIGTDIDDAALLAAGGGGSSSLKVVILRECERVTGAGLLGFVRGRGSDFSLVLQDCINVTQQDIVALSAIIKIYL